MLISDWLIHYIQASYKPDLYFYKFVTCVFPRVECLGSVLPCQLNLKLLHCCQNFSNTLFIFYKLVFHVLIIFEHQHCLIYAISYNINSDVRSIIFSNGRKSLWTNVDRETYAITHTPSFLFLLLRSWSESERSELSRSGAYFAES